MNGRSFFSILMLAQSAAIAPAFADDTGFASAHDLRREGGRLCMESHFHSGSGDGATKPAAMRAAHQAWYDYTAWEYGSDWARWAKSASKGVSYAKTSSGWSATVESRPCK